MQSTLYITYVKWGMYLIALVVMMVITYMVYTKYVKQYSTPDYSDNREFDPKKKKGDTAELLYFYTTWCPYCKEAAPVMDEMKSDYPIIDDVEILYRYIDCEKDANTAKKYNVSAYPTIKLVYNDTTFEYDAKPNVDTLKMFITSSIST